MCVQVEGRENSVQRPLPWSRLGKGQERTMAENRSTSPVPFPKVRAEVSRKCVRNSGFALQGLGERVLVGTEGRKALFLATILYDSHSFRRAFALCPQPLELPSQFASSCLELFQKAVWVWRVIFSLADSLPRGCQRGLKITWENHFYSSLSLLLVRGSSARRLSSKPALDLLPSAQGRGNMCVCRESVKEDWINPCFLEEQGGLPLVRVSLMQTMVLFTKAACKVRLDSSLPSPSLRLCPPPVLWLVGTALICAPPHQSMCLHG